MTALEYMQKQVQKHCHSLGREIARGAPKEVLDNLKLKIGYYESAVQALQAEAGEIEFDYSAED